MGAVVLALLLGAMLTSPRRVQGQFSRRSTERAQLARHWIGLTVVTVLVLSRIPLQDGVSIGWYRWLWAVAVVTWAIALGELLSLWVERKPSTATQWVVVVLAVVIAIVAVARLVASAPDAEQQWSELNAGTDQLLPAVLDSQSRNGRFGTVCALDGIGVVYGTILFSELVESGLGPTRLIFTFDERRIDLMGDEPRHTDRPSVQTLIVGNDPSTDRPQNASWEFLSSSQPPADVDDSPATTSDARSVVAYRTDNAPQQCSIR